MKRPKRLHINKSNVAEQMTLGDQRDFTPTDVVGEALGAWEVLLHGGLLVAVSLLSVAGM